jgi:hypothetical protein
LSLWKAFHNNRYAKVVVMQRSFAGRLSLRVLRVSNLT